MKTRIVIKHERLEAFHFKPVLDSPLLGKEVKDVKQMFPNHDILDQDTGIVNFLCVGKPGLSEFRITYARSSLLNPVVLPVHQSPDLVEDKNMRQRAKENSEKEKEALQTVIEAAQETADKTGEIQHVFRTNDATRAYRIISEKRVAELVDPTKHTRMCKLYPKGMARKRDYDDKTERTTFMQERADTERRTLIVYNLGPATAWHAESISGFMYRIFKREEPPLVIEFDALLQPSTRRAKDMEEQDDYDAVVYRLCDIVLKRGKDWLLTALDTEQVVESYELLEWAAQKTFEIEYEELKNGKRGAGDFLPSLVRKHSEKLAPLLGQALDMLEHYVTALNNAPDFRFVSASEVDSVGSSISMLLAPEHQQAIEAGTIVVEHQPTLEEMFNDLARRGFSVRFERKKDGVNMSIRDWTESKPLWWTDQRGPTMAAALRKGYSEIVAYQDEG